MYATRRTFHRLLSTSLVAGTNLPNEAGLCGSVCRENSTGPWKLLFPLGKLPRGPHHHWFGYYDKREFDPTGRLILANQVKFEEEPPQVKIRSPSATSILNAVTNGMRLAKVDHGDGNKAACFSGWVPMEIGSYGMIVRGDQFVCRIFSMKDRSIQTLPRPIYTVSRDGRIGLSVDFRRIDNLRPGYGYDGLADPNVNERAPEDSGIWRVDLETGESGN